MKAEVTDSWLTAKTKIALYADERIKGGQISVETVHRTVRLRGKVDSEEARTAAASIAEGIEHVKAVKNDLEVVAIEDRKATDLSDKDITSQVEARFAKTTQRWRARHPHRGRTEHRGQRPCLRAGPWRARRPRGQERADLRLGRTRALEQHRITMTGTP